MDIQNIEKRLAQAYDTYLTVICPMIMQLEVLTTEFPVPILNEIRAFTTHIAKLNNTKDVSIKEDNVIKAERHIKRMLLDCYKHTCIAYDDEYRKFQNNYKNVDLSVIDNGDFLTKISTDKQTINKYIKEAKIQELSVDTDEESVFSKYEDAYNLYSDLMDYIIGHYSLLNKAKHKYTVKNIFNYGFGIVGVISLIVTIISFVAQLNK